MWHDLREDGERVGKNTVALLMRRAGLMPRPIRRFRVTTDSRHTLAAPNALERNFRATEPNRSWVTDITFIPTREGWLYLCAVVDLYSRAVIGWSMSSRMKSELVSKAMQMAIQMRQPSAESLRCHQSWAGCFKTTLQRLAHQLLHILRSLLFSRTFGIKSGMKTMDIKKMSKEEKLELMETIWEDLSKTQVSAPAWHKQALKDVEDRAAKGLEEPVDWKDAKNQLRSRFA